MCALPILFVAIEEFGVEFLLGRLHPPAKSRLRHVRVFGGHAEVVRFGHQQHGFEFGNGQRQPRVCHGNAIKLSPRYKYIILNIRSEEHTSELKSLMRISYAVFCLKKKIRKIIQSNKN